MEFDQAYNGAVDWTFPSPGATPTNTAFTPHNVLHTPKTTTTFPSHFQDAFATPHMPSHTPRQAEFPNMAAVQRPHTADMQTNASYYAHLQMNGQQHHHGQAMPSSHPGGGYQHTLISPAYDTSRPQTAQPAPAMSYDAMQMQTPPPTRGSSVKKPQLQPVAFGTPSTIASRRFVSPQVGQQQAQHAHVAFHAQQPQLQFSPDMYQFSNFGPASAPVMPQTQLFWDNTPAPFHHQLPTLDDPFAPTSSSSMQWPQAPLQQNPATTAAFNTPTMHSFPIHAPMQQPAPAVPLHHSQPPPMTTTSVDPSLVYSSPVRPPQELPTERPQVRQTKLQATITKPNSTRKASGNVEDKHVEHKRTDTMTSAEPSSTTSSSAASRHSLQRSNTTGTTRAQTSQSFTGIDSLDRRHSVLQAPRTASPLKRVGKSYLGSISESKKCRLPSVVLQVDESGRARTVRVDVPRESSPTKSLRERYPGLYDSDSSDEESDDNATPSRSTSFSFSRGQERLPKAARLDPSLENLDGLSIPRTSSAASLKVTPSRAAIAAAASLRRGSSLRKRTPSRNSQRRVASSASSIDVAPMEISQGRSQSNNEPADYDRGSFELNEHNRRWSIMSQQSISPTYPPQSFDQFSQPGPRQPRRQVRCQCGVNNERGQMVQCSSCTQFQHADCVGMAEGSVLPPQFTCFLCTKPTTRLQVSTRRR